MIAILGLISVLAKEPQPEMYEMHATAYILTGTTASGEETRDGICASGRREWIGKTVIVYQRNTDGSLGSYIGTYEVLDTGCKKNVIDVWCDGMPEAKKFMKRVYENGCKGKIYVQVIDANG